MSELDEGWKSNPSSMRQIFRASLIYGWIGLASLPVSFFFSSIFLIVPMLICATQFIDIRTRPKEEKGYIRVAVGLIIYAIVIQYFPMIFRWLFDFGTLTLLVLSSLVLGFTFPDPLLRKADGSRSALSWVVVTTSTVGVLGFLILGAALIVIGFARF